MAEYFFMFFLCVLRQIQENEANGDFNYKALIVDAGIQ